MRKHTATHLLLVVQVALLIVFVFGLQAQAAQEVCPNPKVESQTDGDLNDIVLPAGTLVCVKGATDLVWATADGQQTLFEILGNGHDVSHYHIAEQTTTTTTVPDTSTTTVPPVTTTTPPDQPTTTTPGDTTTVPDETSSTTLPDSTTTTDPGGLVPTVPSEPTPTPTLLPYTGMANATILALIATGLVASGVALARHARS